MNKTEFLDQAAIAIAAAAMGAIVHRSSGPGLFFKYAAPKEEVIAQSSYEIAEALWKERERRWAADDAAKQAQEQASQKAYQDALAAIRPDRCQEEGCGRVRHYGPCREEGR